MCPPLGTRAAAGPSDACMLDEDRFLPAAWPWVAPARATFPSASPLMDRLRATDSSRPRAVPMEAEENVPRAADSVRFTLVEGRASLTFSSTRWINGSVANAWRRCCTRVEAPQNKQKNKKTKTKKEQKGGGTTTATQQTTTTTNNDDDDWIEAEFREKKKLR